MKKGAYTALITPFNKGKLDMKSFEKIVRYQVDAGISGILIGGTTGESPNLSTHELELMTNKAREICQNKAEIMLGIGKNSTESVIRLAEEIHSWPIDSLLVVSPYYNKPTQKGLIAHFTAIADKAYKPIVLYNVPGRTSCNILPETVKELSQHNNIIAIKEASGSINQASQIIRSCQDDFLVYSGDDSLTLPMMSVGAAGVISVASNIIPSEIEELVKSFISGDFQRSKELHLLLFDFMKTMFIETNPIPIKYAASLLGLCSDEYRLPMCGPEEKNMQLIKDSMKKIGIL